MEMIKVSAGKLHAIGYDAKNRTLRVQLDDGSALEYSGIAEALWRRFQSSGSQWSFYRATRFSQRLGWQNPFDDLFKS